MKKILSHSKMRETMPLPPKKGVARAAVFLKGEVTELEDSDYKFLSDKNNSMLSKLIEMGVFNLVDVPTEKPTRKQRKQQNKEVAAKAKKDDAIAAKTIKGE